MPSSHAVVTFAVATFVLLLIPGPAVLYIIQRSVTGGRRIGLAAVAGLELGDVIQVIAAAAGLSAIIVASSTAFAVVKWAGVAYLIVVGLRTLTRPADALDAAATPSTRHVFRQGVVVNALNPKTAMFFLAIFPQFVEPRRGHVVAQSLVLGAVFVVMATVYNGSCALAAGTLGQRLVGSRSLPFVRRWVSGAMFVGLGLLAATAQPGGTKS